MVRARMERQLDLLRPQPFKTIEDIADLMSYRSKFYIDYPLKWDALVTSVASEHLSDQAMKTGSFPGSLWASFHNSIVSLFRGRGY